jgi:hypothetical protein
MVSYISKPLFVDCERKNLTLIYSSSTHRSGHYILLLIDRSLIKSRSMKKKKKLIFKTLKQAKQLENTTSTEVKEIRGTGGRRRWTAQHLKGWTKKVRVVALWLEKRYNLQFFFLIYLHKR